MGARKAGAKSGQKELFSRYEDGYLFRTLGDLVRNPVTALAELVANSWDAGASEVEITIPEAEGGQLRIQDDGCGLTADEFYERWMMLSFNRQSHLGPDASVTPSRTGRRRAYGRNGEGRHGLLCFNDHYIVETGKAGIKCMFRVAVSSGATPFKAESIGAKPWKGHGTKQAVTVERNLPNAESMRVELACRFSHDPQFVVRVNGSSLPYEDTPGQKAETQIKVTDPTDAQRVVCLQVRVNRSEAGRTKHQSGVAFWVGKRLVGQPGWTFLDQTIMDGRSKAGRQLTIVVESGDLYDEVNSDWTGFKPTGLMFEVARATTEAIQAMLRTMLADEASFRAAEALQAHEATMDQLEPLDVLEVVEVARAITRDDPLVSQKVLDCAVTGVVRAKGQTSRSGLISRLSDLDDDDIQGLHRLLDEWTVKDALTVLDEINVRLKVVEAIEKLEARKDADELALLHPLVTEARWLFGPEYDSPTYASNLGLRNAMRKVFKVQAGSEDFENSRKRPDILMLNDGLVSAVATDDIDPESSIVTDRRVLLIELKKGGFVIGRDEVGQAEGYIEDLLHSGHLAGRPFIHAFVVGHEIAPKTTKVRTLGEPTYGRVEAVTFGQLVAMAQLRLFRIKQRVGERYPSTAQGLLSLLQGNTKEAEQLGLSFSRLANLTVSGQCVAKDS